MLVALFSVSRLHDLSSNVIYDLSTTYNLGTGGQFVVKFPYPINHCPLTLNQSLTLKTLIDIATAEARMFHVRKVSKEKRHPELRNGGARILLELSRVSRIVLRGENLHRDGNLIDVAFGEKRRVADGDAVDQWRLVLAGSEAECGPPAITEPDRADEGIFVSQRLCASENLRFSDLSPILGQESFQVDFLPITTQHGLQRQDIPSKEIRNIDRRPDFFSVVVSQQAGIREGPTKEIMDHQDRSRAVSACDIGVVVPKSSDGPALLTIPSKPLQTAGIGAHCKMDHGFSSKNDLASI